MEVRRFDTADEASAAAADFAADRAERAIADRGTFTLALSGGSTPWRMLEMLAGRDLPWQRVHVLQVDERQAPDGDPDRNLTHIRNRLVLPAGIPPENVHAMPVNAESSRAGVAQYAETLTRLAGRPAVLDLVHLGLGGDGHTASLLPDDRLLEEQHADVGFTPPYNGYPRMSLTLPAINRARRILWLILGDGKAQMLGRLLAGDTAIPAGRVAQPRAMIFTDVTG